MWVWILTPAIAAAIIGMVVILRRVSRSDAGPKGKDGGEAAILLTMVVPETSRKNGNQPDAPDGGDGGDGGGGGD